MLLTNETDTNDMYNSFNLIYNDNVLKENILKNKQRK